MNSNKDPQFYLDMIEGKHRGMQDELYKDEPEPLRESMMLNHAFDMLVEIGDGSVVDKLTKYLDERVDEYSYKKSGALTVIGALGSIDQEALIEPYLCSADEVLSFISYCSMCNLLVRRNLSANAKDRLLTLILDKFEANLTSVEEIVEGAKTLKLIDYPNIDQLVTRMREKYPDFWDEYRASLL